MIFLQHNVHCEQLKMSVPVAFTPGVEVGASLEGNLEVSDEDVTDLEFKTDTTRVIDNVLVRREISDFGDKAFLLDDVLSKAECTWFVQKGEEMGFEPIYGVRDDYRDCKR